MKVPKESDNKIITRVMDKSVNSVKTFKTLTKPSIK